MRDLSWMNVIGRIYGYQSVRAEELANSYRVILKPAYQKQPDLEAPLTGGALLELQDNGLLLWLLMAAFSLLDLSILNSICSR